MAAAQKNIDTSWDFKTAYTKRDTHCYHVYPAMMIPQIAERLIAVYGAGAQTLFDPYCGTGTSLVEASIMGINSCGTDLNPLARLIAEAKVARISLQALDIHLKECNDFFMQASFGVGQTHITVPHFKNIDFWFTEEAKEKLAVIKQFIDNIKDKNIREFFFVALSETIRESSLTRNSEFKLYRMKEKQRLSFHPDVFAIMQSKLVRNRKGLQSYLAKIGDRHARVTIFDFDTSKTTKPLENESIDIVVTSPPYGDSRTTVAYGQFSRLASQWLGLIDVDTVDNQLMGGIQQEIHKTPFDIVDKTVEHVAEVDEKRAKEVYSFYVDYSKSIANVARVVKRKGYVCYVVGNRRVKGVTLPTDKITQAMFEAHGFKHTNTFVRTLPNKRMPLKNSPTNKIGIKEPTMNNEYIVVLQKY